MVQVNGKVLYFIVGIDGSQTPDPRYWQDRWEAIPADCEAEAIRTHLENLSYFYRPEERNHVKVIGTIEGEPLPFPDAYVRMFIRQNNL